MTKVSFYVLPNASHDAVLRTACRICDKAYGKGHRIYVQLDSQATAARLDDLLWTFRDGSFVPHCRSEALDKPDTVEPAVLLGLAEPPPSYADVLINLGTTVPECFSRFERVTEILDADEGRRHAGRERFKYYRDRGYEIETHKL